MSSRRSHRFALIGDGDVLHTGIVAAAACVFSAGLVYLGYFVHVWRVARRAPCRPERGECVLLFGKHAPQGRIDRDFAARLDRAVSLWSERRPASVVLLGGGADGEPSEAEVARNALLARGVGDVPLQLEAQSRDTLQNLRNARELLRGAARRVMAGGAGKDALPRVTLLSNRYHLARCALFARQLGFDCELCAAEPHLPLGPRTLLRLAGEAAYVCWSDLGTRWARLIGHRRMLARVT
jgi:vancomycin permeability regulator SanA